jgi:hypothetical protein
MIRPRIWDVVWGNAGKAQATKLVQNCKARMENLRGDIL